MWLFEKETNDKISLEKYLPSAKMHEYAIRAVLETVFEAEWLRREGVFFFLFRERKDHENDLEMTRLKVNCKDSARIGKKRQEFDRRIRLGYLARDKWRTMMEIWRTTAEGIVCQVWLEFDEFCLHTTHEYSKPLFRVFTERGSILLRFESWWILFETAVVWRLNN